MSARHAVTFAVGHSQTVRLLVALAVCAAIAGASMHARVAGAQTSPVSKPARIVSLVPAVTEILFAIGAGPQVVGVSTFDRWPPEAATRTKVGGLLDPDLERIFRLRPELVITYGSQVELQTQLERANIDVFRYRHGALADVTRTILEIGGRVGHAREAEALATRIETDLQAVARSVAGLPRPKTMLVFGRSDDSLRQIHVSGGYGFLHDLLTIAGGVNVFGEVHRESVQVSTETILARSPEVIVELRPDGTSAAELARARASWSRLPSVSAVRHDRVVVLAGDELLVPGPRVVQAARALARAVHGERAVP